jgi:hypothetical protein
MKTNLRNKIFTAAASFALCFALILAVMLGATNRAFAAIYGGSTITINTTTGTTLTAAATLGATNSVTARGAILSVNIQNYQSDGSTVATDACMVVFTTAQGLTVYSNTVTGNTRAFPRAVATDTAGSTLNSGAAASTNFEFNVVGIPFDALNATAYKATVTGIITRIKFTYTDSL